MKFTPPAADLTSPAVQSKLDARLFKIVHDGKANTAMGAWREALTDDELTRLRADLPEGLASLIVLNKSDLIATPPGGHPQVSILPFVKTGDEIELHCEQAGFEVVALGPFGDLSRSPGEGDWNFSAVARAR